MILCSVQFVCDGDQCDRTNIVTGNPDTISNEVNKLLERGWKREGRKCYCPDCGHDKQAEPAPKIL